MQKTYQDAKGRAHVASEQAEAKDAVVERVEKLEKQLADQEVKSKEAKKS